MPFITAELYEFTLDKGRFSDALRETVEAETRKAAGAFLRAAFPRVPYRTGFARGGFLNLMDVLKEPMGLNMAGQLTKIVRRLRRKGAKTSANRIRQIQKSMKAGRSITADDRAFLGRLMPKPKKETPLARILKMGRGLGVGNNRREYYKKTVLKNAQNARQFATPMHEIFKWQGDKFMFNYGINIIYFRINDFFANPKTPSSPWLSFISGVRAFNSFINKDMLKRLPNLAEYFSFTQVRVVEHRMTKRKLENFRVVNRRRQ